MLLELPDLEEIRKASVAPSSTQMYTRLASEIAIFIRKSTFDGDAHWQARLLELVGLRLLFSVPLSTLINKNVGLNLVNEITQLGQRLTLLAALANADLTVARVELAR